MVAVAIALYCIELVTFVRWRWPGEKFGKAAGGWWAKARTCSAKGVSKFQAARMSRAAELWTIFSEQLGSFISWPPISSERLGDFCQSHPQATGAGMASVRTLSQAQAPGGLSKCSIFETVFSSLKSSGSEGTGHLPST